MAQKLFIVAVKDRAAEAFARPAFFQTEALALRSFVSEVNTEAKDNPLFTNPTDFELHVLGTFDDESGLLEAEQGVTGPRTRILARAEEVKRPKGV